MAENLSDFMQELEATPPPPFVAPEVRYGPAEDSLLFYFRSEESYARRINPLITVFLSTEKHELVGCQVKGLKRKLKSDGQFSITIRHGKIRLGLFFHLLAFDLTESEPRSQLIELGQQARDLEVDTGELALSI